jgi:hypothetical protein
MHSGLSVTLAEGFARNRSTAHPSRTMTNIGQNLFVACFSVTIGVPLAVGDLLPLFGLLPSPVISAAAMSLSLVLVVGKRFDRALSPAEAEPGRFGDRLRVNLTLLRAPDGQTLWSDTLNVSFADIFTMQDDVSRQVATGLCLELPTVPPGSA